MFSLTHWFRAWYGGIYIYGCAMCRSGAWVVANLFHLPLRLGGILRSWNVTVGAYVPTHLFNGVSEWAHKDKLEVHELNYRAQQLIT